MMNGNNYNNGKKSNTKFFSILILSIFTLTFLTGCLGEPNNPKPSETINKSNGTSQPSVQIVLEQQKNQTSVTDKNKIHDANDSNSVADGQNRNVPEFVFTPEQRLGIYFINIANGSSIHGNAILVKKGDFDMLIDAGSKENTGKLIDFLTSKKIDDIDVLLSSNADPGNYGGLVQVAERFPVETFWHGPQTDAKTDANVAYNDIIKILNEKAKKIEVVERGFGANYNGIMFSVLNPQPARFEDANNDAVVLKIINGNTSVLLTSGIQTGAQGKLLNEIPDKLKADVTTAPYYGVGSGTSNINQYLSKIRPPIMILTGSNDESATAGGSREPFRRQMKQYGVKSYEIYVNGTLELTSDGETYDIHNFVQN